MSRRAVLTLAAASACLAAPVPAQTAGAQTRLWDAAIAGDTLALRRALDDGAQVDSMDPRHRNGRRALNWAALNNRPAAIALLVAAGAHVNLANRTGFTPLHHAAEAGALEAAQALLAAGADPELHTDLWETPAELARVRGHEEVASVIEEALRRRAQKP